MTVSIGFCLLLPATASATHLMGGWAGYQYLGLNSATGNYKYLLTFKVYRYCEDQTLPCGVSCNTATLDATIDVGAYTQDWLNPNNPNKILAASFVIPLSTQSFVPLPGAAQCATAPVVCVEEGVYATQVELPPSNGGYHLMFQRCCRNTNIINIVNPPPGGTEGQNYYAFIPPTFINNSSPVQLVPPVPYICVNDTASILNTAIDPDGDVIVYSLVQPYASTPPAVAVPLLPNPYTFPIPVVPYQAGYSAAQPFGAGGYSSVNSFTGLSSYLSPAMGYYVVAVEMQEFRNNQLIGITRLDIQIIVITCPPNNPPALSSSTSQTGFIAQVGDSLCFPIKFADANPGDSVFLAASGTIFGPPTNPAATLTPNPNAGLGSVTSQFCWDMGCNQPGNYIFIVQSPDNGCPPKITNVVYTIQVLPYVGPATIMGPNPLCTGASGTYSVPATSGTTFSWVVTGGNITSGQGTNSININWTAGSGTVSVTSYNVNGCPSGPISLNVSIQSPPVINAGPNTTICAGSSVTFTSGGGGSYSWNPSAGLSNPNISNPVASPTTTTNYIVTVTSSAGCANTDTVSVTLHAPFTVNAGNDLTVCTGGSVSIGGTPSGPAGSTYMWSPASGLSSATLANPVATPAAVTTYTLIVTSSTSCKDTDFVTVFISSPPVANAGSDITVCPGFNTTLNGIGGGTYNWSPSGSLNNANISNPVASPTTSTTYTLIVTLNNCNDTDYISMSTLPFPAINAGADKSICIGASATLSAAGTGTFLWGPASTLSCSACANPVATPTATTNYTVTITDASSCTNTDMVQVIVNPLPLANAGPKPGWVCPGFSLTLSASNGMTYSWVPAASLNNTTIANPVATPTATTQYTVNITDANGCANRDTVTITSSPNVPTNAGNDLSICIGQSTTLGGNPTAPVNVTGYIWVPATGLSGTTIPNPVATPASTTTYVLTTTSNTCNGSDVAVVSVNALPVVNAGSDVSICIGNSTTLTGSGATSYAWNTGATTTSITAAATAAATYTVTGTDANGCTNSDLVSVWVNALPVVSAGGNLSVCIGTAATLTGSGATSYAWNTGATTTSISVSPTAGTTYTVTGTDANGCSNVDSATVFVSPQPAVSAGADVSICIGSSAILTGSGAQTYVWNTGATTTSISVGTTSSSTYSVVGTDVNGCTKMDTVAVFVSPKPVVSAGPDVSVCFGNGTTLTGIGGQTFIWSPAATLNNANISNPVATPSSTTTYTMVAADANSCSNTDTVNVTVLPLPTIFASNDTAICPGKSASLNASGGVGYSWNPASSLNNSTVSNPIASPTANTTYTVTITNSDGCTKTDSVKVTVNPSPLISAGSNTVVCPGSAVTLNATGGVTYVWTPFTGLSNATISNPDASPTVVTTYTVVGTDANGCTNSDAVTVSTGIIPTANFGYTLSLACKGMQAQFLDSSINATGWSWNFGDGGASLLQNPAHTFAYSSSYKVILNAMNPPCWDTAQITIAVNDLTSYVNIETSNVFTPNNDGVNDCFRLTTNGRFAGCADLTIYDRWGVQVYRTEYSGACWDGHTSAGIPVPQGTYFYMFDLNGIQLKGFVTLLR